MKKPEKKKTPAPTPKSTSKTKKAKNTVKALREKHLKDEKHVITDEEINKLDLELGLPDASTAHTPDLPPDSDRPKDEDKDPKIITPWDVIK